MTSENRAISTYYVYNEETEMRPVLSTNALLPSQKNDEIYLPQTSESTDNLAADPRCEAVAYERASGWRKARQKLQGWRRGVVCCFGAASAVLLLNVALTIWVVTHSAASIEDGIGSAFVGSCTTVGRWSTGLHIAINALSTVMLSASSYTMQCLNAPTREEIDRAHANGNWLDVGVLSFRNVGRMHWHKVCLWAVLAFSSIPVHLLYNSAIFKTTVANNYLVGVVNEDFLDGAPYFNYPGQFIKNPNSTNEEGPFTSDLRFVQQNASTNAAYKNDSLWERLSNSECIKAYGSNYISDRTDVLALTSAVGSVPNQTAFWAGVIYVPTSLYDYTIPYNWICASGQQFSTCDIASIYDNAEDWTLFGFKIDYCLSKRVPEGCKLQFSVSILATVIIMNALKSISMLLTARSRRGQPLVTIGDALTSFLDYPDRWTKGCCMMAKVDVSAMSTSRARLANSYTFQQMPVAYLRRPRRRWVAAASVRRWSTASALIIAALSTSVGLLVMGYKFLLTNNRLAVGESPFGLGFGTVDHRAIIVNSLPQNGNGSITVNVLLANLPQLICSMLYFVYNGPFTCMLLCHEYSQYALHHQRHTLRVTKPRGKQKSTYHLQLPHIYSIPLVVGSALLHWLISQSIFLVKVDVLQDPNYQQAHLGCSLPPILCTILLGSVLMLIAAGFAARKLSSCIPVAGSCSAALSAACHPPMEDRNAAYLSLRWGSINRGVNEEFGHCTFTSKEVHEPVPGTLYAG